MENNIKCPNCGHLFGVEDAISHQVEEKIKKDYEKKIAEQANIFNKQKESLEKEKEELEDKKKKLNEVFIERVKKEVEEERNKLQQSTKEEFEQKIKLLEDENSKRKSENIELRNKELILLKRENELKEKQENLQLDLEKKLLEKRDEIATEVRKKEQEKTELRIKEYEKKLEDQIKLIEEMKRKSEQGSMQMQGEVQELAIEEWLKNNFPLDNIEEIKKGARGADCVQIINTHTKINCGTIYYESKRTKDFQQSWIEKFKEDIRQKNASFGVLVTDVLPKDMDRFGQKDGIWICRYEEFKGLCFVLRESVIMLNHSIAVQENKGDKMTMLYDFLTGSEFRMQVEAIVDGFTQMNNDLISEKRAMEAIWKKREKQIQKVVTNTNNFYGSIKGIGGNAIATIKALELPEPEVEIGEGSEENNL